jgi:transposase
MEDVLDVYHRPYDESRPLVCLDESSKQLIGETREPIPPAPARPGSSDQPGKPGHPERYDFEYVRNGTANLFMVTQPLLGWRHVEVTDRRTAKDFAEILRWLAEDMHPDAKKIVLVMDNLNTHKLASLYEAFEPSRARALAERFEIHHTPKHGSWLNMAEIEFSVLGRQCLHRRIATKEELIKEIAAWEDDRNDRRIGTRWRFTVDDARIKLHRLYPASE